MRRAVSGVLGILVLSATSGAALPNEDPVDVAKLSAAKSGFSESIPATVWRIIRENQGLQPVEMKLLRKPRSLDGGTVAGCESVVEVTFLTDAGSRVVTYAPSGAWPSQEKQAPPAEDKDRKRLRELLNKAPRTLGDAIDTALKEAGGGTLVHAEAELDAGELEYELEVLLPRAGPNETEIVEIELTQDCKVKKVEGERAAGRAWIFDTDQPGQPPPATRAAFTHVEGSKAEWKVASDAAARSPCNVLRVTASSAEQVFNLLMFQGTSYGDLDLSVKLRADTGKEDQGGGLIWRCKDPDHYYICRLNPLEKNFRVYKVVDGKREQLASASTEAKAGEWHTLRAVMIGDKIACYLGDKKLLEAADATFKDAGMIGLWTKADASSSFDDLAVRPGRTGDGQRESGATSR